MPRAMEPRLQAALKDALSRPGSLVRALVAYLLAIDMGMSEGSARALGCGLEYLHTASLIFDDLPAMDDALTRRGAPSLHVTHGQGTAMLTALALINRGYSLLWLGLKEAPLDRRTEAGDWIDECLGVDGLTGGQAYDLAGWQGPQDPAEVGAVAVKKTAALLRLAVVLPALGGRGTQREIQLLDRLAILRGLAYQAADDIKDAVGSEITAGKSVGRDSQLGRPNLVSAEGLDGALLRFHRLGEAGDRVVSSLPGAKERWGMLAFLKVPLPVSGANLVSAAG